ncbi:MAG: LpxL/LpxP family Kdo(2)-lipid IV(A) lauroyl/palmitoleoyl acyltransferase [Proteobacteria bacterium]|nr:LpxL/LpxP family Kdo(2)-lipid IV(A) lauroyl/palmitoleoyl acyltransferase [Pseudomonadota bacterium]
MPAAPIPTIPLRQFAAPRYWPTWIGLALMWIVAHLPFAVQIQIGKLLGILSYHLARERRHICEVNLRLCFPELSAAEQRDLVRQTFISNAIGLIEIAIAWYRNPEDFRDRVSVSGLENLDAAINRGKGVLLLCAHFTTLEFGGFLFNLFHKMDVTYRRNKNPLFEAAMYNGRIRHYPNVFDRKDVRGAMRSLKQGRILWYAPDQDYGAQHSVIVPFFGNPAATITATSRFASVNDSAVVFFSHYRNEDNSGYHLEFSPMLKNYPSGDLEKDAKFINEIVEAAIRKQPDQYLWLHKRFKTQAAGKQARPY